ncbi:MAG: HyaD/HybD family hydrogenase maturation endopeptidase [Bryobacteraceae bacterium]
MPAATETIVLGIGNVIHSDDGAGVHAARMLHEDARLPQCTTVIEGGTLGLELLPYLQDVHRLLLLDAIDIGEKPGTILRLSGNEVYDLKGSWSVHQLGVADLLAALRLVRSQEPEITILGIQPGSTEWGTDLTPEVNGALPALVDAAIAEMQFTYSE